ncbi:Membrane associated serine protease, rhomboid family [Streptomyces sp. LamerLS-316]|uniref:rhomboid family intramembrane serine protease n=1 Tax=unclassified Streptomyces TaxID=2593676 RepID=UPI000823B3B4|nr:MULTISPECIES: rhomboid family intramembrane serine protease [unclassified Streptomyces]MYQ38040.1 rhomboid family intramembrane serine protease [Streptomyces sp. SID4921]SCK48481.1 Membrane associated serine protease, rhomboid family [Streptomyces sp. LamerLS-316]
MEAAATTCYRHPSYETYVRCTRCDRYICPDCMREASVGHHCVECVQEGQRSVRQARSLFGGSVPRAAAPVVTYVLMALNIVAYVVEIVRSGTVDRFGMLGAALVGPDGGLYVYGGWTSPGYELTGVAGGEWYRLLTGAFLHLPPDTSFGVMHLVFNMLALWNLGRIVEGQLGRVRFTALYLLSAVGGSVLVYLVSPETPAVGASGAVFGLAASFYVINRRLGRDMQAVNRFMAGFLLWMVISAAFTSWEGHLGGLVTGGLVTYGLAYAPARLRTSATQLAGGAVLVVLLAAVVAVRTAALTGAA